MLTFRVIRYKLIVIYYFSTNKLHEIHNQLEKKLNPDLGDYITLIEINGLFILIARQEKVIRRKPKKEQQNY